MKTLNILFKFNDYLLNKFNFLIIILLLSNLLIAQTSSPPIFTTPGVVNPFGFNTSQDGEYAPVFFDYDNDGDCDLFMGRSNSNDRVFVLHENTGTSTAPNFSSPDTLLITGLNSNPPYNNWKFIPALADLDHDGDVDLIVGRGSYNGGDNIEYYKNTASSPGNISFNITPTETILWQDVISPAFTNNNNLYIGGNPNYSNPVPVYYSEKTGNNPSNILSSFQNPSTVNGVTGDEAAYIALGNLGGTKAMVVCDGSTEINWFSYNSTLSYTFEGLLLNGVQQFGHPALIDIDNDGDNDLFVGMENQFVFFENTSNLDTICCDENQNIVQNGSVSGLNPGISSGNLIAGGPWIPIKTPQVDNNNGCNNNSCNQNGCFAMWGNQVVGEAVAQKLTGAFIAGHTYDISFCSRYTNIFYNPPLSLQQSWVKLTAANSVINPHLACPNPPTCTTIGQSALMDQNNVWINTCITWTPANDYDYIIFSVENNSASHNLTNVSWAEIDDICIQDVGVIPTPCMKIDHNELQCDHNTGNYLLNLNIVNISGSDAILQINPSAGSVNFTPTVLLNSDAISVNLVWSSPITMRSVCFTIGLYSQADPDILLCDTTICFQCEPCPHCCCDEAYNLVENGSFSGCPPYTVDMDTSCLPWKVVTETPQTTPFDGCSESGCARIWGNQVVGESFGQDVTFSQGYTYRISFCAKFWDGDTTKPIQNTQVFFTASTSITDPRTCTSCETMATSMVLTNDSIWETYCVDWTPEHDYKFFSIHNENSSDSLHGDSTSWALIDDVCITLIDSTTQTNELMISSSDFNIYPNPSSNSFILESKNEIYEPVNVFIYDFSGRKVKELSFERLNKISIIKMEDNPSGVYFLQVANDSKVYFHTKIIKID